MILIHSEVQIWKTPQNAKRPGQYNEEQQNLLYLKYTEVPASNKLWKWPKMNIVLYFI